MGIYTAFIFRFILMQKRELIKKKKIKQKGRWKWISETWLDPPHLGIRFREINGLMGYSLEQIFREESGARMAGGFPSFWIRAGKKMKFELSVRENLDIFRNFTPCGVKRWSWSSQLEKTPIYSGISLNGGMINLLFNEGLAFFKGLFSFFGW